MSLPIPLGTKSLADASPRREGGKRLLKTLDPVYTIITIFTPSKASLPLLNPTTICSGESRLQAHSVMTQEPHHLLWQCSQIDHRCPRNHRHTYRRVNLPDGGTCNGSGGTHTHSPLHWEGYMSVLTHYCSKDERGRNFHTCIQFNFTFISGFESAFGCLARICWTG